MTLKNIVWLASYPKSGNTWTRAFLINYLLDAKEPVPINQIHRLGIGDAITKAYRMVAKGQPFNPGNIQEVIAHRPAVLRGIASNGADMNFVKSHNQNGLALGQPLVPSGLTRSAIYILRNPLDLIVSFARHYGHDMPSAIEAVRREDHVVQGDANSVTQFVGNWSGHVAGWVDCDTFPVHVMRYEDMLSDPHETFGKLVESLGFPLTDDRLERAIQNASFDELSKQEAKSGFVERSANGPRFFHTGTSGQWADTLTADEVAEIRRDHAVIMKRYGYL
ncbi:MAG: sulfotransferase domain-containing protein [Pseudomonadota bacterium]